MASVGQADLIDNSLLMLPHRIRLSMPPLGRTDLMLSVDWYLTFASLVLLQVPPPRLLGSTAGDRLPASPGDLAAVGRIIASLALFLSSFP
jgi:hypothetical protein